jgi:hypothetical protein
MGLLCEHLSHVGSSKCPTVQSGAETTQTTVGRDTIDRTAVQVVGKMGHHSFRSLRGYGNLYADNTDAAGTVHGPSVQSSDMGTVFLRHAMKKGTLADKD